MISATALSAYLRYLFKDERVRSVHDLTEAQLLHATKLWLYEPDVHEEHLSGDDRQSLVRTTAFYFDNVEHAKEAGRLTFRNLIANTVIYAARVKAIARIEAMLSELRAEASAYRSDDEMARDLMPPQRSVM